MRSFVHIKMVFSMKTKDIQNSRHYFFVGCEFWCLDFVYLQLIIPSGIHNVTVFCCRCVKFRHTFVLWLTLTVLMFRFVLNAINTNTITPEV